MNKIKIVVLDIDGTLVTSSHTISPLTKQTLITLQENGIRVMLASGRPTPAMRDLAHKIELHKNDGYMVSFNGACISHCETGDVKFSQAIPAPIATNLLEHLKSFDVMPIIVHENYTYVNNVYDGMINPMSHTDNNGELINILEIEARSGNYLLAEVEDLATFATFPLYKVLVAGDPAYLKRVFSEMTAPFKDTLNCVSSAPFFIEFTDRGIDKAGAVEQFLSPLGYSYENVIAFGDGHNDASMLKYAGIGVAMGNAVPEVKEIADTITLSNDEDGIAVKLHELFPEIFTEL
ncbi:HAD family phosphatase [Erysipelothrix sp. HDW6C]|uniref:Cof-type HAD-IIB family hydrolase n=1 Tax=Erysipelothrix sp. HDW6C TaxID=2714930 RepID=UPI00140B766E|nr:Cof-type HAD-IIB family hydrolase [Erysipelothrix sp. HDW6C]QIK68805.1 HAD family phosphatase [Erysipelothrix sp. HDW6C]